MGTGARNCTRSAALVASCSTLGSLSLGGGRRSRRTRRSGAARMSAAAAVWSVTSTSFTETSRSPGWSRPLASARPRVRCGAVVGWWAAVQRWAVWDPCGVGSVRCGVGAVWRRCGGAAARRGRGVAALHILEHGRRARVAAVDEMEADRRALRRLSQLDDHSGWQHLAVVHRGEHRRARRARHAVKTGAPSWRSTLGGFCT